jgi:hypothetical protein
MSNFELIDDYLANRLNEADKQAFEQQLEGDPSLKRDVEFQRQVVEGVRHARAIELKSMLNNVPVGGSAWTGGKMAAAVVSAGLVATLLYFYLQDNSENTPPVSPLTEEIVELSDGSKLEPTSASTTEAVDSVLINEPVKEEQLQQKSAVVKKSKATTPVRKPDIQVTDPSDELNDTSDGKTGTSISNRGEISPSKMEVVTGVTDKKHSFHYQFSQGKLMLFGPFDKSLYEILEIHGDGHAVFLFYKENYYLLDEAQSSITALQPIRDGQLLKRLKEYRGK